MHFRLNIMCISALLPVKKFNENFFLVINFYGRKNWQNDKCLERHHINVALRLRRFKRWHRYVHYIWIDGYYIFGYSYVFVRSFRFAPLLTIEMHPIKSSLYYVGTADGIIHECSIYDSFQHKSFKKVHKYGVYSMEFSPWCPKIYLTCGFDWFVHFAQKNIIFFVSFLHIAVKCGERFAYRKCALLLGISKQEYHNSFWKQLVNRKFCENRSFWSFISDTVIQIAKLVKVYVQFGVFCGICFCWISNLLPVWKFHAFQIKA